MIQILMLGAESQAIFVELSSEGRKMSSYIHISPLQSAYLWTACLEFCIGIFSFEKGAFPENSDPKATLSTLYQATYTTVCRSLLGTLYASDAGTVCTAGWEPTTPPTGGGPWRRE
jgi:hypothetical protein